MEDVRGWLNPERARRPDQTGDPNTALADLVIGVGGIAAIAPGMEAFLETTLTPGDYVLTCMVTAPDGRSHIEHGMMQQIKIS